MDVGKVFEAKQCNRSWVVRVDGLLAARWTREILRLRGGEGWQNRVSALGPDIVPVLDHDR